MFSSESLCTLQQSAQLYPIPQVSGIAEGLDYMHGHDISHGDLKCSNVLVTGTEDQPVPLLCDFGLSKVSGMSGYTTENEGTHPWMAKEILRDGGATPAGDIWSWGMTVLVSTLTSLTGLRAQGRSSPFRRL